jgi:hypothetical protein
MRSSPNVMNCVEFGFDRSRGFGSVRGQFWPIAIDRPTRPYNIASTTVQQVIVLLHAKLSSLMKLGFKCIFAKDEGVE